MFTGAAQTLDVEYTPLALAKVALSLSEPAGPSPDEILKAEEALTASYNAKDRAAAEARDAEYDAWLYDRD